MKDIPLIKLKYIYIAAIIYLITAFFSVGHNHPDEYYQILEFAAYKLGLADPNHLTWEFHSQMRSTFQSSLVVLIFNFFDYFNYSNPFFIAFITRLLSAILSLVSLVVFIKAFINTINREIYKKWFILLSLFSWLTIYNNVRFSSENLSGKFFILGLAICYLNLIKPSYIKNSIAGIMLGLCFVCRFQSGFLILGLFAWLLPRGSIKNITILFLSTLISILVFGLIIDHWFYGAWIVSPLNYFYQNIILNKVNTFDNYPWFFYLYIAGLIPWGPFFIISPIITIIYRPKNILTWVCLPFLLVHILIGHKEFRFLVPILNLMPLFIVYFIEILEERFNYSIGKSWNKIIKGLWYFNLILIIPSTLLPSATQISLCKLVYTNYHKLTTFYYITEGGNELDFYKRSNLSTQQIKDISEIKCDKSSNCLVALTCQQAFSKPIINGKLIYSLCPRWITKLDFNQWLERTAIYNVYELNSIENQNE